MLSLPFVPVTSMEDVTADLEQLQSAFARGSVTLTWAGSTATSGTVTVSHGLPNTPGAVTFGAVVATGNFPVEPNLAASPTLTSFQVFGTCPSGSPAANATATVYWFALL